MSGGIWLTGPGVRAEIVNGRGDALEPTLTANPLVIGIVVLVVLAAVAFVALTRKKSAPTAEAPSQPAAANPDDGNDALLTRARGLDSPAGPARSGSAATGDVLATRGHSPEAGRAAADDAFATRARAGTAAEDDAFATRARQPENSTPPDDAFATRARASAPGTDDPFATRARGGHPSKAPDSEAPDPFATRARAAQPAPAEPEDTFATRAQTARPEPMVDPNDILVTRAGEGRPDAGSLPAADDPFATRARGAGKPPEPATEDPFATRARGAGIPTPAPPVEEEFVVPEEDDVFATRARAAEPGPDDAYATRARAAAPAPGAAGEDPYSTRARAVHPEPMVVEGASVSPAAPSPSPAPEFATELLRPAPAVPPARLRCLEGAYNGQTFDVTEGASIGRQVDNHVCLERDSAASRRHAEIVRDGDVYRIRDLGSANGTLVNDVTVAEVELKPGDEIRVGRSLFKFEV